MEVQKEGDNGSYHDVTSHITVPSDKGLSKDEDFSYNIDVITKYLRCRRGAPQFPILKTVRNSCQSYRPLCPPWILSLANTPT